MEGHHLKHSSYPTNSNGLDNFGPSHWAPERDSKEYWKIIAQKTQVSILRVFFGDLRVNLAALFLSQLSSCLSLSLSSFSEWTIWEVRMWDSHIRDKRTWWPKLHCCLNYPTSHQSSHEKTKRTFHDTGCLTGILIMGYYNPLYTLNNQFFSHCLLQ